MEESKGQTVLQLPYEDAHQIGRGARISFD